MGILRKNVEDRLEAGDHLATIAKGDSDEYDRIASKSKIKLGVYAGGVALGVTGIELTEGFVEGVAIGVTVWSGFGVWNNAAKLLLYGHGVDEAHSEEVSQHIARRDAANTNQALRDAFRDIDKL